MSKIPTNLLPPLMKRRVNKITFLCCLWMFIVGCLVLGPPGLRYESTIGRGPRLTHLGWRSFADVQPEGNFYVYGISTVIGAAVMFLGHRSWARCCYDPKKQYIKRAKLYILVGAVVPMAFISFFSYVMATSEDPWKWNAARETLVVWFGLSGLQLSRSVIALLSEPFHKAITSSEGPSAVTSPGPGPQP